MERWLYKWLPILFGCHCRDDRSFHLRGRKFPICARCTGELAGILCALLSCLFFRPSVGIAALMLIPMILDGFIQQLTSYESNNRRRFVTGFFFGYGLFMLFILSSAAVFRLGYRVAQEQILR